MKTFTLIVITSLLCSLVGIGGARVYGQSLAGLRLSTVRPTYGLDQAFEVLVTADPAGQSVNAAEIDLAYPINLLSYVGVACSECDMEVETPVTHDAENGQLIITRATARSISNSNIEVVRILFRTRDQAGKVRLTLHPTSKLIGTDGSANILQAVQDLDITIDTESHAADLATETNPSSFATDDESTIMSQSKSLPDRYINISNGQLALFGLLTAAGASVVWAAAQALTRRRRSRQIVVSAHNDSKHSI